MCFPKIYPDRLLENFYGKSQNPTNSENIRESLFTLIQVPTLPTKKIQWYRHIWCVAKNMMFFLTDGPTFARWPWAFLFSLVSEKRKKASLWVTSHRCDVILEKVANPQVSQDIMPNAYPCHTVPTFHICPKIICQFCSILYLLKFSILFPNTMHSILLYNYLEWSDCWRYEQWDSSSKNLFLDPLRSDPRFRTTRLIRLAKNPFEEEELASWLRLNRRLPLHWARIGCKLMRRCSDLGLKKKILKLVSLLVKQNK